MWFRRFLFLAFFIAVSSFSVDSQDDVVVDQHTRQKRWAFTTNCVNNSDPCIDGVSNCCNDNSKCQIASDGTWKCAPITTGASTCAALPMIGRCDYAGYDKNTPPAFALNGGQTTVHMQVTLKHISKDLDTGLYNLDFHLVQFWNDTRLAHQENRLMVFHYNEQIASIWRPDVFVSNAITAYRQDIAEPARSLRIYQDGLVRLSQRIQATVPCSSTYCQVALESYGNIVEVLNFAWIDPITDALKFESELSNTINKVSRNVCNPVYNGRSYPCLKYTYAFVI